jgi:hypothetical protein
MSSLTALLAVFVALVISLVLALCMPVWASVCIVLVAVVTVSVGGGALLAKVSAVAGIAALVAWLSWRSLRNRVPERIAANVKWLAIPVAQKKSAQAAQRPTQRRAA